MNSKHTKRALFSSVLALVLCFSMMLGTTFAWFTDSVTSVNNIIKAGNLDVDVVDGSGESIQDRAALFEGILWEPGVVAYENLTVKNLGTLALNYAMTVAFDDENHVTTDGKDYSLSSALKIAVVPNTIDTALSRSAVLDLVDGTEIKWTNLKAMSKEGVLYPTTNMPKDDAGNVLSGAVSEQSYGVIIYWEPTADDNNWNVQNGKTTDDGQPLHITLGVHLLATQYTYEEDSFDKMYDDGANVAVPTVDPELTDIDEIMMFDFAGTGNSTSTLTDVKMDIYSFVANDFQGTYPVEEYKDWTCDFFVSTDGALEDGMILVGTYQNYPWLGFWAPANDRPYEPIGLLGFMTNGGASNWTYEAICNEVQVFRCGLLDYKDLNDTVKVTVELRMTSPDQSETITVSSITVAP